MKRGRVIKPSRELLANARRIADTGDYKIAAQSVLSGCGISVAPSPSIFIGGFSRIGKTLVSGHLMSIGKDIVPMDDFRKYYHLSRTHPDKPHIQRCRAAFYSEAAMSGDHVVFEGSDVLGFIRMNGDFPLGTPVFLLTIDARDRERKIQQLYESYKESGRRVRTKEECSAHVDRMIRISRFSREIAKTRSDYYTINMMNAEGDIIQASFSAFCEICEILKKYEVAQDSNENVGSVNQKF